jgi:hypothetical protein
MTSLGTAGRMLVTHHEAVIIDYLNSTEPFLTKLRSHTDPVTELITSTYRSVTEPAVLIGSYVTRGKEGKDIETFRARIVG